MLIISAFSFFVALLIIGMKHNVFDVGVIFNVLWAAVCLIRFINPFNYYDISNETVFVIALGCGSFNVGLLFCDIVAQRRVAERVPSYVENGTSVNVKRLTQIQIVLLLFLLAKVVIALPSIVAYGGYSARAAFSDGASYLWGGGSGSQQATFERYLYIHYGIIPCAHAAAILSFIYWSENKLKPKHLIVTILNGICIYLITFARGVLLNYIVYMVFAYALSRKQQQRIGRIVYTQRKKKRNIYALCACFVILIASNTIIRTSGAQSTLIKTVVSYFTGGIQILDVCLSNKSSSGLLSLNYGSATFDGMLSILTFLLKYCSFGLINLPFGDQFVDYFTGLRHAIGENQTMNSFPTAYYYFYRDFSVIGVALVPFAFSVFARNITRKARNHRKTKNVMKAILVYLILIYFTCWWLPYRNDVWMYYIHALWIMKTVEKPEVKSL